MGNYFSREDSEVLADVKKKLTILHSHLIEKHIDDARVQLLKERFHVDNVVWVNDKELSNVVNKKQIRIGACLKNNVIYVAIHLYSLLSTDDYGHTPEFWKNFKFILEEADKIGVYHILK